MKSYPKYRDSGISWIGIIPEHWSVKRIKDVAVIFAGATPSSKINSYWDGDIVWVTPADMTDFGYISKGSSTITDLGYSSCGTHLVPAGSIIFSSRAPIGKVNITTREMCTNQGCKSLVLSSSVNGKFIAYYLYNESMNIDACGQGTTFKELSLKNLVGYRVILPPLNEQCAIASYLDEKCGEIDGQVALLEKKQKAYERFKMSIINDAVTHGLNPNVTMRPSGIDGIDDIPAHWSVKRFKEFAYTIKGKNSDYLDEPTSETGIVLTLDALRQEKPSFYNYAIVTDSDQHCTKEDLVIIWDGAGVGEFLKAKNGVLSSTIAKINVDESKVLKDYLWQWRYMIEYRLKSIPTGMGIPHLNPTLLNQFLLAVPPLDEQREIADYLNQKCSEIDATIENTAKQIDAYKRLKKSLINEVVTGKRAV